MVILVALVALCCAWAVHEACFHPPPPVTRPDGGTPRGGYCDAINATRPWLSLTLGPTLVMALIALSARRLPWLVLAVAVIICVAMITNAIVAHNLVSALTA
jgi:hypothetical protein